MLTDVDLPAPGLLWTRWATLASALTGLGYADVWFVDERGAHRDDHAGSWARLALLDGSRAVLFGYDRDHSETITADPPVDLLTGAPGWLPWDDLVVLAEADRLGFTVWHEAGRWSRVRFPAHVSDGLMHTVGGVLSTENTLRALGDVVQEWGQHELATPAERDEVREASEQLLAAAVRGEVTAAAFERLLGRLKEPSLDTRAAVFAAGRGGLTPGSKPPRIHPGEQPPMRRVRMLSQGEHDRLVWATMREATELTDRPAPPHTPELEALVDWMREHPDSSSTVLAYADAVSVTVSGPVTEETPEALIRALRRAESDPRYGRWLFLRVEISATQVQVERRYDSWPPWWSDDGTTGPWRSNLQEEMAARAIAWRPSWVPLLDPEVAFRES